MTAENDQNVVQPPARGKTAYIMKRENNLVKHLRNQSMDSKNLIESYNNQKSLGLVNTARTSNISSNLEPLVSQPDNSTQDGNVVIKAQKPNDINIFQSPD